MMRTVFAIVLCAMIPLLSACHSAVPSHEMAITSLTRTMDTRMPVQGDCEAFVLTRTQVITFFKNASEVSGPVFHNEAMILPCMYEGTLTMGGATFRWSINAGGAGFIYENTDDGMQKQYVCRQVCKKALQGIF